MTQPAMQGTLASSTATRALQAYASAAGLPSPTQDIRHRIISVLQGNYRTGIGTDGITQSAYFVEQDGILGEPELFEACAYSGTQVTFPTGSFTGKTFNPSWRLWVPNTIGDWSAGVYTVTAKADDQTLTVTGPISSTDPFTGYLLEGIYAEPYMALGAPTASATPNFAAYSGSGIGPIDQSPWHDYGPYIMPGTLVNGGEIRAKYHGRIRMASLAGRPFRDTDSDGVCDVINKCEVYFTIDPYSCALAHPYRASGIVGSPSALEHNELLFFPPSPTRLGWNPSTNYVGATFDKLTLTGLTARASDDRIISAPNFDANFPSVGMRFRVTDIGTTNLALATDYFVVRRDSNASFNFSTTKGGSDFDITSDGTVSIEFQSMRVNYTAHGRVNKEVVHITAFDIDEDNVADHSSDLGVPSTLTEGQGCYVQGKTANAFFLSEDIAGITPVDFVDDASETLIISQPVRTGSHHAMTWAFEFTTSDEIADFSWCTIDLVGSADGRTADSEEGVNWRCELTVYPNVEKVGTDVRRQVVSKTGLLKWGGAYSRTTPGASMAGEFTETTAVGAPLFFLRGYYTATDAVSFTGCVISGGSSLEHPNFQGVRVGDSITISSAPGTDLAAGDYFVHSKTAGNPDTIRVSATLGGAAVTIVGTSSTAAGSFLPTYGAFKTSMWDWGGAYDIVHIDSDLVTLGASSLGMTDYPVEPTYQGNDVIGYTGTTAQVTAKNASPYREATVSRVKNAAGTVMGEICYHDPLRRVIHVRPRVTGEHITYGDALTIETFRNVRTGTTWANESSAVQTKTCNALAVEIGPNGTRLSTRIAVSGPPTGECELNIRTGIVETFSVGSR